jgi:hypothetical protein
MVQYFENENMISENTCEVFMNDVMGKNVWKMWNKPYFIVKNEKNIKTFTHSMKNLKVTWYKFFMLGFFVNDKKNLNVKCPQQWDVFFITLMQSCFVTLNLKQKIYSHI